jgi:hypothetical protein
MKFIDEAIGSDFKCPKCGRKSRSGRFGTDKHGHFAIVCNQCG